MRFCKTLAIVAVVALAMVAPKVTKAQDPKVKLVIPTDPTIEPCSAVPEGITCFSTNSISNPVQVTGPDATALSSPGYDFITNFIYEPDDSICSPTSCPDPAADALMTLWIAIVPTLPVPVTYSCDLAAPPAGETAAFNECPASEAVEGPGGSLPAGTELIELECDPTAPGACTGMLPGEEGSAEIAPEPGELAMLGLGIALVGFCGWKRRQAVEANRTAQQHLAIC